MSNNRATHGGGRRWTGTQRSVNLKAGASDMHVDKRSEILPQFVAVLTLTAAATVGSTSVAGTTVLFEQPSESAIANNFWVAHLSKAGMPEGLFDLVLLQPNPESSNGELVPTTWDAGAKTGFVPASPSTAQLGFRNDTGTSTAQMEGDTVGAYLNSADLPTKLSNQLMMIAPQYIFLSGATPVPFASSTSVLNGELNLQVPTAVGKDTYISADFVFMASNGMRVSYAIELFHNEIPRTLPVNTTYDRPEDVYILEVPLYAGQQFVTLVQGSESATGTPWVGYRHFQWSVDQAQFVAALKYLVAKFPGKITSTDPTQYVLDEVHLNAEFHYSPAPAELGWSMQGWQVWVSG